MKINIIPTVHHTVRVVGIGQADDSERIRRSIASRAGRYGVGPRLSESGTNFGDGRVEIRVIYAEK